MKLWKIWGLDDLPIATGGLIPALTGFNIHASQGAPTACDLAWFHDRKWWHGTSINSSPIAQIAGNGFLLTGKLVFGGRVYVDVPSLCVYGQMYSTSSGLLGAAVPMSTIGIPANKETYVEVVLDFVALTLSWYLNGNPTPTYVINYSAAQMAAMGTYSYMFGGGGTAGANWYTRDINWREYAPGESYVPWARISARAVRLASIDAIGYTSSNGDTPVNVLNTNFTDTAASYSAPTIDNPSPLDNPVITANLVASGIHAGTILGMELFSTAKSTQNPLGTLTPQFKQNSASAAGVPLALAAAFQNRKSLGVFQTMPDGSAMTKAKINQSQLILTAS